MWLLFSYPTIDKDRESNRNGNEEIHYSLLEGRTNGMKRKGESLGLTMSLGNRNMVVPGWNQQMWFERQVVSWVCTLCFRCKGAKKEKWNFPFRSWIYLVKTRARNWSWRFRLGNRQNIDGCCKNKQVLLHVLYVSFWTKFYWCEIVALVWHLINRAALVNTLPFLESICLICAAT